MRRTKTNRRPSGRAARRLDLSVSASAGKPMEPYIRRQVLRAARVLRGPLRELSIALVGDALMSRLHKQFLQVDGPTDVISFPLETDGRGRVLAGEVVVCVPEARRQAKRRKIRVEKELLLYCLHGMLHLRGFDDQTAIGYRKMHAMEDRVLRRIGTGPIFHVSTDQKAGRAG